MPEVLVGLRELARDGVPVDHQGVEHPAFLVLNKPLEGLVDAHSLSIYGPEQGVVLLGGGRGRHRHLLVRRVPPRAGLVEGGHVEIQAGREERGEAGVPHEDPGHHLQRDLVPEAQDERVVEAGDQGLRGRRDGGREVLVVLVHPLLPQARSNSRLEGVYKHVLVCVCYTTMGISSLAYKALYRGMQLQLVIESTGTFESLSDNERQQRIDRVIEIAEAYLGDREIQDAVDAFYRMMNIVYLLGLQDRFEAMPNIDKKLHMDEVIRITQTYPMDQDIQEAVDKLPYKLRNALGYNRDTQFAFDEASLNIPVAHVN